MLTKGSFQVERVIRIDEEQGWIYFSARADKERIYDTHLYRINFNGENFE